MNKKIYTILLLHLSLSLFAQSHGGATNRCSIVIDPIALVDIFSCPSYRFGAEARLYQGVSLYLEGGGYFQGSDIYINVTGYTIKAELKTYDPNEIVNTGSYLSLAYFYKKQTYAVDDILKDFNTPLHYTMDKNIHALTLKYGYLRIIKNRLLIDSFFGLGVRYKNVDCIGLTPYEIAHRRGTGESEFAHFRDMYGISILPNIDIGVRIGYILF
jgi:hypothetical protein